MTISEKQLDSEGSEAQEAQDADLHARFRQAVRIGYVEMERIVEEVIVPEFEKVGSILIDEGYEVEVIVFDSDSPVNDKLFVCGAGLRVSRGNMHNAAVYTGDPYRFEFALQTHNYVGKTVESFVDYHRLTPVWFHKNVMSFLETTFPEVDFGEFKQVAEDQWDVLEGPFVVKLEGEDGEFTQIAESPDIEEAMKMASMFCSAFNTEDKLVLEDSKGRTVC